MREENAWKVRRQVPESDPEYKAERKSRSSYSDERAFGEIGLSSYKFYMDKYDATMSSNKSLQVDIAAIESGGRARMSIQAARNMMQANLENAKKSLKERAQDLRESFKTLMTQLIQLNANDSFRDRKRFISRELNTMFKAPDIQEELKMHFGDDFKGSTPINVLRKIVDGSISDDLLYIMAQRHMKSIHEQEARLAKIVQETKIEFKERVNNAVTDGFLPKTALAALYRVDSARILLSDALQAPQSLTLGTACWSGAMSVGSELLQGGLLPKLKRVLYHEFLHELSGKSITIKTNIRGVSHRASKIIYHRKSGVALSILRSLPYPHGLDYAPNDWMNEAITDWLAIELSGYANDTGTDSYKGFSEYSIERKDLDRFFALGLEKSLATDAYFEDFSSEQPREVRGRYFTKLIQRADTLSGPFGLSRLENQHIMRTVASQMYTRNFYPADVDINKLQSLYGARIFNIAISVGAKELTRVDGRFIYPVKSISANDSPTLSVDDSRRDIEKFLSAIAVAYGGKVKYSVTEKEHDATNIANPA